MLGATILGGFSLVTGFLHDKVIVFVLRGFAGVCAAMTIPSALSLIVENFPEQGEQAIALSLFSGTGEFDPSNSWFAQLLTSLFIQPPLQTCLAFSLVVRSCTGSAGAGSSSSLESSAFRSAPPPISSSPILHLGKTGHLSDGWISSASLLLLVCIDHPVHCGQY